MSDGDDVATVLKQATLKEGEYLVLVCNEPPSVHTVNSVPEPLKDRVVFVSGAKAFTVLEEIIEELKCRSVG